MFENFALVYPQGFDSDNGSLPHKAQVLSLMSFILKGYPDNSVDSSITLSLNLVYKIFNVTISGKKDLTYCTLVHKI